jgi:CubicO group peptidase (beta-lactamase class C family)
MSSEYNSLHALASDAISAGVIPGVVIAAGRAGQAPLLQAFGQRQVEPQPASAAVDTVYDLASLTKALVTSVLVMRAVSEGRLELDEALGRHLPALADRPELTLRRVLAHAGGLAAHRKFYDGLLDRADPRPVGSQAVVRLAAAEPLAYAPGARSLYSDLGFILLGAAVERALGGSLDVLAERLIFRPLGVGLRFVDLRAQAPSAILDGSPVAPTERCPVRRRLVVGEVHDLNAFAMGGVAGHAGLFGRAADVFRLAFALCAAYHGRGPGGGEPLVSPQILREFWQPSGVPGSTWRLGWDGPSEHGSLAGDLISRRAVGHLGFTGCSLWIDPDQEACVVVLTNRVHPMVRDDPRFRVLRPALHDAALRAIDYQAE